MRTGLNDHSYRAGRARRRTMFGGLAASAFVVVGLLAAPIAASGASATARPAATTQVVRGVRFATMPLKRLRTVNLRYAAAHLYAPGTSRATTGTSGGRVIPLKKPRHVSRAARISTARPKAVKLDKFGGNLLHAGGFDGITALMNGGANSPEPFIGGVGDVSPPDQGLAVGPSPAGTVMVEFVNDTLNIYSPSGTTLLGAVPAFGVFGLPPNSFLSDPRVYWDSSSGHWFLTMFTVGNSGGTITGNGECSNGAAPPTCLSTQYIAVSVTTDPFGSYTVFSINTSDSANAANGCPCFGDYDQVGSDSSGFYIETNEFPLNAGGPGFNGSVIYAISKSGLISAANGGAAPTVERYTVPLTSDPFAGYHVSPSTMTQGSTTSHTEYFVESNANLPNNATATGLEVFALLDTNRLAKGLPLTMVEKTVNSESYTEVPPNATQKSGPTPLGSSVGFSGTALLQTDFSAVQEVTYASGKVFAELDTGFAYGTGERAGAAYFVLHPSVVSGVLSVAMLRQGYVETSQNLLYPVIGVNNHGVGFMAFDLAGPSYYPSAAYVSFSAASGAGNVVHIAANGVDPLDDFTCYPYFHFSTGQCRFGDYSMAQAYQGEIYMATEYVAPQPREGMSNWATRVYWAPTTS